jgi:flagellar motor switch protein FliN/FliY
VANILEPSESQQSSAPGNNPAGNWNIDLLLDVELPISVSFGHCEMALKDVLKLGSGSVIELDKAVNDPVSIIVNHNGVRILEVESTADRIRSLG